MVVVLGRFFLSYLQPFLSFKSIKTGPNRVYKNGYELQRRDMERKKKRGESAIGISAVF